MKKFEQFFTETEILRYICKIRIKIAKTRNKKHLLNYLTTNPKYNYHLNSFASASNEFEQYQIDLNIFLSSILPSRRKWVKLGEPSRRHPKKKNEFLTSNDKNFYALLKTIKVHRKKKSNEQWFLNLQKFIQEIKDLALSESYEIQTPIIFPKLKDDINKVGKNECRPICIFNIRDRIILSITNKYLTQLFDKYFQDSAYAFRAKRNSENQIISHHDCIKDIRRFRKENDGKQLFVVECDMKKFYDTVNHSIVKELFHELISKAKSELPLLNFDNPIRIFNSYLNCYAFSADIAKSTDTSYWESYKIRNGVFTWIDDTELSSKYSDISKERIGVPQGGALSCLISNIYLNQADIELKDLPILYQRFCDDMIIISDNIDSCSKAKELYGNALNKLKLFPHKFKAENELLSVEGDKLNYKKFWDGKSKGPYRWGKVEDNDFPWIGFVGYEINYLGDIRVRKKSLDKELKKQKKIIKEIEKAIFYGMRKPKGTATESAINRLIGMSVGRIGIDNFDEVSTDMCWKNGFKELTLNQHSVRQIKQLDRNRNKLYFRFLKEAIDPELEFDDIEERQVIRYNKPFSYYYQVLERQKKVNG